MSENHRSIVLLCNIRELPQQEVAEILGIEVWAVDVRLHRVRTKLGETLKTDHSFTRDERHVLVCEPTGPKKE